MTDPRSAPFPTPVLVPDLIERLRDDLRAAGWTVESIEDRLGPAASAALHRELALPARRALVEADDPLATLTRLFALGDPVDHDLVEAALPTLGVAGATRLGLLEIEGAAVRATCDLRPYGDESHTWWVASDLSEMATGSPLRVDHVLGIGGASTTLASWTPRSQVGRALDLGTGCGVQALHLAGHADAVTVTDVSERALAYARFNAALAGQDWEVLAGSMLEPVAGRQFDLVVSNPPFVITPRSGDVPLFEYRDGGSTGDAVVAGLVRGVAPLLAPGGTAQLLGNWEIADEESWQERVRSWLEGTGLDALVVQREVQDPVEYAQTWARDGGHRDGTAAFDRMLTAWLEDFESRGVTAIGFGIITLHRPAQAREPWVELLDVRHPVGPAMGEEVAAVVAARSALASADDDELLSTPWRAAADVTVEQHQRAGAPGPEIIRARRGGGLRPSVDLGTAAAALLSVCDGDLTAGAALAAISGLVERETDEVTAEVLPTLRELVARGFLVS